ncbi:pro-pol protein [Moniliophthora roreri]|nr:pro-pol protein [Moniliophthora roreri]
MNIGNSKLKGRNDWRVKGWGEAACLVIVSGFFVRKSQPTRTRLSETYKTTGVGNADEYRLKSNIPPKNRESKFHLLPIHIGFAS